MSGEQQSWLNKMGEILGLGSPEATNQVEQAAEAQGGAAAAGAGESSSGSGGMDFEKTSAPAGENEAEYAPQGPPAPFNMEEEHREVWSMVEEHGGTESTDEEEEGAPQGTAAEYLKGGNEEDAMDGDEEEQDDDEHEALAMFELVGGGIGVMPDPADNPDNHVLPHHESGTRISFEVLNVGDAGGNAEVGVELDGTYFTTWSSSYLDPGQREVGYVNLGRLSQGSHTVLIYVNPGSGQADHTQNQFDVR